MIPYGGGRRALEQYRIESELEVQCYLQDLRYALDNGARLIFQENRRVDDQRPVQFTNRYTVAALFPNEAPPEALRRELKKLRPCHYLRTVRDIAFPNRSEMREFGMVYDGQGDVYIKLRVELLAEYGGHTTFVMSFHFAERPLAQETFPYAT